MPEPNALNSFLNFFPLLLSLTSYLCFCMSFFRLDQSDNKHLLSVCSNHRFSLGPLHPEWWHMISLPKCCLHHIIALLRDLKWPLIFATMNLASYVWIWRPFTLWLHPTRIYWSSTFSTQPDSVSMSYFFLFSIQIHQTPAICQAHC